MKLLRTKYTSFAFCGFREEDFFMFFSIISLWQIMTSPGMGMGLYGLQGHGWQDLKRGPLYTKYESSGHLVSEKKMFLCLSHCKSMGANDPRGGDIFYPRGMIRRIYVMVHITMLHTKYRSVGSCGFREEDLFMYFLLYTSGRHVMTTPGWGLHGP